MTEDVVAGGQGRMTVLTSLFVLLSLVPVGARGEKDTAAQQVVLLLRVLAYDRTLPARAGAAVTIAVAYKEGDAGSEAVQRSIVAALDGARGRSTVAGLPLRAVAVPFGEIGPFAARVIQEQAAAIYVCPGMDDRVDRIAHIARRRSVLTFSATETYVRTALSVGLVPRQDRVAVLVNLPASRAEGISLDAALLRVVEVLQ